MAETCVQTQSRGCPVVPGCRPYSYLPRGSTDVECIAAAVSILRPDITDLVTFLDPKSKPEQSASALARMVKQFSAARIAQPVVALFDNDTAGHKERDTVPGSALPPNIKITTLPNLALARAYPTIPSVPGLQIDPN